MQRAALSILLLGVMVLGIWQLRARAQDSPAFVPTAPETGTPLDNTQAAVLDQQQPIERPSRISESATSEVPEPAANTEASTESFEYAEQSPTGTQIEILQMINDQPAPGAIVLVLPFERFDQPEAQALLLEGHGMTALQERFGTRYLSDANGIVRVDLGSGEAMLRADWESPYGALRGALVIGSETKRPFRIALDERTGFDVVVYTSGGDPAPNVGVQYLLRNQTAEEGLEEEQGQDWHPLESTVTNTKGTASLNNTLQEFQKTLPAEEFEGQEVGIGLAGLFRVDAIQSVDWRTNLPRVLEFRLPDCGSVNVRVAREDGTPVTDGVLLVGPTDLFVQGADLISLQLRNGIVQRALSKEHALLAIPYVEVGQSLVARYYDSDREIAAQSKCQGPRTRGETVDIALTTPVSRFVFQVALTEGAGSVAADRSVRIEASVLHESEVETVVSSTATANSQGLLTFDFPELRMLRIDELHVVFRSEKEGKAWLRGEIPIARDLSVGHHDLGAVRLQPAPLLVSGKVQTLAGEALECNLRAKHRPSVTYATKWQALGLDTDWRVRTASDGTFEIRGFAGEGDLLLHLEADGYALEEALVAPQGTSNLWITPRRTASLQFRCVTKEDPTKVVASLTRLPFPSGDTKKITLSSGQPIHFEGNVPGSYQLSLDLDVRPRQRQWENLWSKEIELQEGESLDLGTIDVR